MDQAALNVRRLKKERAPLEVVKAAVQEFKAAKAAWASEALSPGTSELSSPLDVSPPLGVKKPEVVVAEPVIEGGVMTLPLVLVDPATPVAASSSVPKAEASPAADPVRNGRKGGGRARGKGNPGGS